MTDVHTASPHLIAGRENSGRYIYIRIGGEGMGRPNMFNVEWTGAEGSTPGTLSKRHPDCGGWILMTSTLRDQPIKSHHCSANSMTYGARRAGRFECRLRIAALVSIQEPDGFELEARDVVVIAKLFEIQRVVHDAVAEVVATDSV